MSIRDKLRNWISEKWNYEIQCDVFESLDRKELNELATLYDIDINISRLQICSKLAEILEEKKNQYKKILDIDGCANTMDPISATDVSDIDPRDVIVIEQNGQKYCFEIEGISNNVFVNKNDKNPYTNVPFDYNIKQQIKQEYTKYKKLKGNKFNPDKYASDSSLTAWITQLNSYLPYTTGIDKFLKIGRKDYNDFLDILERFGVYLDGIDQLEETYIEVKKDTLLREKKIILIRKLIKWILDGNNYLSVRNSWDYFTVNEIIRYAAEGNLDKIKDILDKIEDDSRIDLTIIDRALLTSISNMNFDIAEYLIGKGADVNSKVMELVIKYGNLDFIKFLGNKGYLTQNFIDKGLISAVDRENTEIIQYFLEKGANVNAEDAQSLMIAVANGNMDLVIYLVEHGIDEKFYYNATSVAVRSDNLNIIKYFIEKGVDIRGIYFGDTFNTRQFYLNYIIEKIENGEDIDVNMKLYSIYDDTLLLWTVMDDDLEKTKFLLERGAYVNVKYSSDDTTPLIYATRNDNLEIIKSLVEKGADVNVKDDNGETPLIVAVINNNLEAVKLLIEKGADINAKDYNGETPLIVAVDNDNLEAVKLLVEKGADINEDVLSYVRGLEVAKYFTDIGIQADGEE